MRKATILVLMLLIVATVAEAAMFNPFRRRGSVKGGMFPSDGDVPDLVLTSKILTYREEKFKEFYGQSGSVYLSYGLENLVTAEYTYGGKDRRVTIELATMETPTAATGLYHYHRGKVVGHEGIPVDVGAEGVVDKNRGSRNLYFYRSNIFGKILYSGKEPVPDLTPIARYIDSKIPSGRDAKPDGFAYIKVPGVDPDTIALTPGFCFNISFFPPAVWASAPGGGSVASDLFIMTRRTDGEATSLYNDYVSYLKLYSDYIEEYRRDDMRFTKSVDPNQGRVVFTAYRNALIIAARPDGYDKGEVLIDAVMDKMDEVEPPRRKRR